jgi:hypothetical protein
MAEISYGAAARPRPIAIEIAINCRQPNQLPLNRGSMAVSVSPMLAIDPTCTRSHGTAIA